MKRLFNRHHSDERLDSVIRERGPSRRSGKNTVRTSDMPGRSIPELLGISVLAVSLLYALIFSSRPAHAQAPSFTDVSTDAGIATASGAIGVSVFDFDGDGWDDITFALRNSAPALFRNNRDGTFTDVASAYGITGTGVQSVALWADVNRDNRPDLFVGQQSGGSNALFINMGNHVFEDRAMQWGIDTQAPIGSATMTDLDGDRALDLFLAVDRASDLLYRNINGDRFEDISESAGVIGDVGSVAMQATWFDYDLDLDPDLLAVHDGRHESRLYDNALFLPLIDRAPAAHIASVGAGNSMGIAWGDVDGNGWPDAYITRIGQGGLYMGDGKKGFSEEALARVAAFNGMSWGVVFSDLDNDGDEDLFIVSTSSFNSPPVPTLLYLNEDGQFQEIAASSGAASFTDSRGLASGDFNRDGLPDLVFTSDSGAHRLLLNTTVSSAHWMELDVLLPSNEIAVGARIVVYAGGKGIARSVLVGDSFCSQNSPTLHFGLGSAARVDSIRVGIAGTSYTLSGSVAGFEVDARHTLLLDVLAEDVMTSADLPRSATLFQGYPNPFDTRTTLSFQIMSAGPARLDLFDILGRRVRTIFDVFLPVGPQQWVLSAESLPPGMYLARLQSQDGVSVRYLTHIR